MSVVIRFSAVSVSPRSHRSVAPLKKVLAQQKLRERLALSRLSWKVKEQQLLGIVSFIIVRVVRGSKVLVVVRGDSMFVMVVVVVP